MRRLGVIALVAALAVGVSSASGGPMKRLDRCSGKPSWRYLQTVDLTEPNPTATFDPDPLEKYKLVFSGYIKDRDGNPLTLLQSHDSAFQVNGVDPPLGNAIEWHRRHPQKDPSAVPILIEDTTDGKSLAWDGYPEDVFPVPSPPDDKPCTIVTGTAQPGEERKWVSVSGFVQITKTAEGQVDAVGGGGYAGVYERPGATPGSRPTVAVRRWQFRVDDAGPPDSGGDLKMDVTVTASGQTCPAEGAKLQIKLHDGGPGYAPTDVVIAQGGCVADGFSNQHGQSSHAEVTIRKWGS